MNTHKSTQSPYSKAVRFAGTLCVLPGVLCSTGLPAFAAHFYETKAPVRLVQVKILTKNISSNLFNHCSTADLNSGMSYTCRFGWGRFTGQIKASVIFLVPKTEAFKAAVFDLGIYIQ